jgi:hypothetical protein
LPLAFLLSTLTLSAGATIDSSSFAPRVELPIEGFGAYWPGVAINDFDGDAKPDILAINADARKFWVFRNTSGGGSITAASFAPSVEFSTVYTARAYPLGVAIGDLDGDGKADLVIVGDSMLLVFRNTSTPGSVSFAPATVVSGFGYGPAVAIRDMDGDGKPEILTGTGGGELAVFRNTSTPGTLDSSSFAHPILVPLLDAYLSIAAVEDLDGDSRPDVVAGARSGGIIYVFRNMSTAGNIDLNLDAVLTVGSALESIAIADFNGDGKPDIAAARLNGAELPNLSIFQNLSTVGNLGPDSFAQVDFVAGSFYRMGVGDVDGDGKPDLVGANDISHEGGYHNVVSVLQNVIPAGSPITSSAFAPKVSFAHQGGGNVAIEDLNGDGKPELVLGDMNGRAVWIFQNTTGPAPDTTPPTITCPANIVQATDSGQCSAIVNYTVTASDDSGSATIVCNPSSGSTFAKGATTVNCTATDPSGNHSSCSFTVTILNPPPAVVLTSPASGAVFPVGTPVTFTGTFMDNAGDTHTAQWTFDTITQPGTVNDDAGSVTAAYAFSTPGVYVVTLAVTDACGSVGVASTINGVTAMVVIYDPNGAYVTGGGWFNSPAGAYTSDLSLADKANFGFVSKYQKGATIPTGETEFQFQVANFNFHSTSYEWLVVSAARAQYKGSGTVNGSGNYGFLLTAVDGQVTGGGGVDKFRIKIWNIANGGVVYDNQIGAPDSTDPNTALGGGSIVIHKE